jgi:hypothetical protein
MVYFSIKSLLKLTILRDTYYKCSMFWCSDVELKCPLKAHVLKTCFPMQQCSEVGSLEGDWVMKAQTS